MTEAQKCLYHIAENMRMDKSISKEGYEYFQQAIKALEQEPCNDAISRQAAIDCLNADFTIDGKENMETVVDYINGAFKQIKALPSVTPQPKTGRWIEKYAEDACGERYSYWACSECGRSVGFNLANIEDVLSDYPYCHCGAKMVEPQESEGK